MVRRGVEGVWKWMRRSLAEYRAATGERDEAVRVQWEWLGELAGKRVLEIGCGAGNILTMEIARRSGEYPGVDVQADRVAVLRRKLESAGLRHARAEVQDVLAENWPWGGSMSFIRGACCMRSATLIGRPRVCGRCWRRAA